MTAQSPKITPKRLTNRDDVVVGVGRPVQVAHSMPGDQSIRIQSIADFIEGNAPKEVVVSSDEIIQASWQHCYQL